MDKKPLAKKKNSAEAEETPERPQVEPARIVAVAGRYIGRFVPKKDGSATWRPFAGHPSLGAELVGWTRTAIAGCDTTLEVVQTVITGLPESVLAKCRNADADPREISRRIERHLPDEGFRSEMIARRLDSLDANPNVENVYDERWRGELADLYRLAADMEVVDQANDDLLNEPERRKAPEQVLRAILRGLGYPKPENLTGGHEPWKMPR